MLLKRQLLSMMQACGLFALARSMSADMPRILMYHNFCGATRDSGEAVSAESIRQQFAYLKRHFNVVALSAALKQLRSGRGADDRTVVMTVDDGRRNFYEFLFPVLKEFKIPATFFVVSSFIRGEDWLWTDKVLWLSEQPSAPSELSANHIEEYFHALNRLRPEARGAQVDVLSRGMRCSLPTQPPAKYAPCSRSELREMVDSGLVELGSHTVTHPILSSLTDEETRHELNVSRAEIEDVAGSNVVSFCFPNGTRDDYRVSQLKLLREAGYQVAVVTDPSPIRAGDDLLQLPRLGVSGRTDRLEFAKHLDGVSYYQNKIERRLGIRGESTRQ